jgi:hypothetical protein
MTASPSKTVSMPIEEYRTFVAIQYLNASTAIYEGLKRQQGQNNFHFCISLRSFIEYTRRGIWFLTWASDQKLRDVKKVTFEKPGSPDLAAMDAKIQQALGAGSKSPLRNPVPDINNEPFINCLHALTHGNPISVRMLSFGIDKIFKTDMLLLRAETDLNLYRILVYRHMMGEKQKDVWKMLSTIHNQPDHMRTNVQIAIHLLKTKFGPNLEKSGLSLG